MKMRSVAGLFQHPLAITLIEPEKGEQTEQVCENALFTPTTTEISLTAANLSGASPAFWP
jgi:hypothetical protein